MNGIVLAKKIWRLGIGWNKEKKSRLRRHDRHEALVKGQSEHGRGVPYTSTSRRTLKLRPFPLRLISIAAAMRERHAPRITTSALSVLWLWSTRGIGLGSREKG